MTSRAASSTTRLRRSSMHSGSASGFQPGSSPHGRSPHLEPKLYEHSSVLKFIEAVFGLPTLASVNHTFDAATPVGSNYQAAGGAAAGPPAPPRDGRNEIGNLMECFAF